MSVKDAKDFIKLASSDAILRKELNKTNSREEMVSVLNSYNFSFTSEDFVEAHSYLVANSPDPETTEELKEFDQWWSLISSF